MMMISTIVITNASKNHILRALQRIARLSCVVLFWNTFACSFRFSALAEMLSSFSSLASICEMLSSIRDLTASTLPCTDASLSTFLTSSYLRHTSVKLLRIVRLREPSFAAKLLSPTFVKNLLCTSSSSANATLAGYCLSVTTVYTRLASSATKCTEHRSPSLV
jgi:hypothetical protein